MPSAASTNSFAKADSLPGEDTKVGSRVALYAAEALLALGSNPYMPTSKRMRISHFACIAATATALSMFIATIIWWARAHTSRDEGRIQCVGTGGAQIKEGEIL